jgi:hypothetical protein
LQTEVSLTYKSSIARRRLHIPLGLASTLLALFVVAPAPVSASAATPVLEVKAPDGGGLKVAVEPLAGASQSRRGNLTAVVTSGAPWRGALRVRYLQAEGLRYDALAHPAPGSPVESTRKFGDAGAAMRPGQVLPLQFWFTLPAGKPPGWLAGSLLFELTQLGVKKGKKAAVLSSVIPLDVAQEPLEEVAFQPQSLTLQLTDGKLEGDGEVLLVGSGAEALVEMEPPYSTKALLANDEGNQVDLTLEKLRSLGNGQVAATVAVGDASPGEYKGKLQLGHGPEPPALDVVLHSRLDVYIAILLVLLSSIIGGFLPVFSANARLRSTLRLRLKNAIEHVEERYDSDRETRELLWDISMTMGPRGWLEQKWSAVSEIDGIAGLYAELRWARSKEELEALGPKVDAAVEKIGCWLLVLDPVRKLHYLSVRRDVPPRKGVNWSTTELAKDTERVLDSVRREELTNLEDAFKLAKLCREQYVWHLLVLEAWTKIALAEASDLLDPAAKAHLNQIDLTPFVAPDPPPSKRSAAQMTDLVTELSQLTIRTKEVVPKLDLFTVATAATKDEFMEALKLAEKPAAVAMGSGEAEQALERVRASTQPEGDRFEKGLQRLAVIDWLLTLVFAVGATLVYVIPQYDSTWGTTADILAALAVGFGTQVVVQWAAMPTLRSLRGGKQQGQGEPEAPAEQGA